MKIILMVLDSVGVGALPDAEKYNDAGADTLGHIAKAVKDFNLPNLVKLGLYHLISDAEASATKRCDASGMGIPTEVGIYPRINLIGSYGKMNEASIGKDTPIGHWEMTGLITERPLPTYPNGFPKDLMEKYEKAIGTKTLGNYASSGTEIIKALGDEHYKTGYPIVYTSADSVFQIAAHEDDKIFGLKRLYQICEIARKMLVAPHNIGRVIARPFIGTPGNFKRTSNRHDYAIDPAGETLLDKIKNSGGEVYGIGKIKDIFNGHGISNFATTKSNMDGMQKTLEAVRSPKSEVQKKNYTLHPTPYTLIFTNLVDFDMLWGHRRDVQAYYNGLKEFDEYLPELENAMADEDVLFITADHGCDPTYTAHTDHTREYVPLFVFGKNLHKCVNLGVRKTFADVGQTIAEVFKIKLNNGESFLKDIVSS
ncbi:MAG: phosphopentomutase [Elusimicrobia bacterium CG06_land_8_20_14_3_00_38_11]|nr:MAG: phosphopentomutase [Elusimicrobia bacterium CG06_land_8_20_14_3_00_38_11]